MKWLIFLALTGCIADADRCVSFCEPKGYKATIEYREGEWFCICRN